MDYIAVRNFAKFQRFERLNPPWLRFYVSCLDDYKLTGLCDEKKGQLFSVWLLASKHNNKLPKDANWISRQINATSKVDLEFFIKEGYLKPYELSKDPMVSDKRIKELRRAERERKKSGKGTECVRKGDGLRGNSPPDQIRAETEADQIRTEYESLIGSDGEWKKLYRDRAIKNLKSLLAKEETSEMLRVCMKNYKDEIERKDTELKYRSMCCNFFGVKKGNRKWEDYTPKVYKPPTLSKASSPSPEQEWFDREAARNQKQIDALKAADEYGPELAGDR